MSAVLQSAEVRFEPLNPGRIDAVCAVERSAYSHPWTRENFTDSLQAGYHCQCVIGSGPEVGAETGAGPRSGGEALIGYFVAMPGVDEVHLLNITVAPVFQRHGWAALMLEALGGWSRMLDAQWLWLEVRASNQRALDVYERHGFRRVGLRKAYYPTAGSLREDAIVMSLPLTAPERRA